MLKILKSKLHRINVTDAKIDYPGSIGIDADIMEAAGILPYESVIIADVTNGNRLETYAIAEAPGSKKVTILGAAAKLVHSKDTIIIFAFTWLTEQQAKTHKPKVVAFDESNNIIKRIS